ncbi:PIN domain-containing protein [Bacillus sp. AK128]
MFVTFLQDFTFSKLLWYFIVFSGLIASNFVVFFISKLLKDRIRYPIVAFILQIIFPGTGYAYCGSLIRTVITVFLFVVFTFIPLFVSDNVAGVLFLITVVVPAFSSAAFANKAHSVLKEKRWKTKYSETCESYRSHLNFYINRGHNIAVDTNFLMHYQNLLEDFYKSSSVHLYLHPNVFGELEGLKKNRFKEVRASAQLGFDLLETYQKSNRLQWTRIDPKSKNFTNPDQIIISGIFNEIESGNPLVFASHDKGARILARSLNIPVVDPDYKVQKEIKPTVEANKHLEM